MKLKTVAVISALMTALIAAPAFASPDLYVMNFRHDDNVESRQLDAQLVTALKMSSVNAEQVMIDMTTAAKWEKSAYEAFNHDLVPVFNKWVGLPGFAAIIDANTKQVIGCVTPKVQTADMARHLRDMATLANGGAVTTDASTANAATVCPDAFNAPLPR